MNNNLYNIDSKFRNKNSFPNSANFVYNRMDQVVGTSNVIEPFNEKNVIEMKILSLELPNTIYFISNSRGNNKINIGGTDYTLTDGSYGKYSLIELLNTVLANVVFLYSNTTDKVTITNNTGGNLVFTFTSSGTDYPSLGQLLGFSSPITINTGASSTATNVMTNPQQSYIFLRINDFGNIINKNHRYVGKIILDNNISISNEKTSGVNVNILTNQFKLITNSVKFDQPTDINQLNVSLEDEYGNLINLNNGEWSFTLETVVITNTILKNYSEIRFYSDEAMDRILKAKMLSYYEKQVDDKTNLSLTSTYSTNITRLNNIQEYTPSGSQSNYSPSYSYFKNN